MASTRAEEFIRDILIKKLNIRAVFVGDDFRFGRGRAGDASLLKKIAGEKKQDFEAKVFSDVEVDGIPLSSSLIREEIVKGNLQTARKMLGRPYTVHEKLQKGSGRGKELGFPTLNFSLDNTIRPRFGVYTVWLGRAERLPAIASFGVHPTVDELSAPILEVHTLGEPPDLKPGQEKHIYFEQFCRPEEKFSSLEELKNGIKQDIEEARRIFLKTEKPAPIY
jgi:riboflavin kinase/FMN adenylyltransferase